MPTRTKNHYMPAPRSQVQQRKLIKRWLEYNSDVHGDSQKACVEKLNNEFGTTMRPWQIIRWRSPKTEKEEERTIQIDYVEYMASHGGIYQIFKTHAVSEDKKLLGENAKIWYRPTVIVAEALEKVVKERMIKQVEKPGERKKAAMAFMSTHQFVAQYLDLILDALDITYKKSALTKKVQQEIADEIYSIVGFDFSPVR